MTLDEARELIGLQVVYRAPHLTAADQGEQGIGTSVNDQFVFIRYGASQTSQATPAERLSR